MNNERHMMIDIETLGKSAGCAIRQIGWAVFQKASSGVLASGKIIIDPQSCFAVGLQANWDTIAWWMNQSANARKSMTEGEGVPLPVGLEELQSIYMEHGVDGCTWAKPPNFDLSILQFCYDIMGMEVPWVHYKTRCVRTIFDDAQFDGRRYQPEVPHDAQYDAIAQVENLQHAWRIIDARQ